MNEIPYSASNYIHDWKVLKTILEVHKSHNKKIVFTNGCFDLLHSGHLYCLQQAQALGDVLLVALNTDASIQRLKGLSRPIKPLRERAHVMAALRFVDYVTCFEHDTPKELVEYLFPTISILAKGVDYSGQKPAGAESVEKAGGKVEIIGWKNEYSTTSFAQRMNQKVI